MKSSIPSFPQQTSFDLDTPEPPAVSPLERPTAVPGRRQKKQYFQSHLGNAPLRLLRRAAVERKTGLSRSSIYRLMSGGDFPTPVQLSTHVVAWIEAEIDQWISRRVSASRSEAHK
jgi:prophage regulatory protein